MIRRAFLKYYSKINKRSSIYLKGLKKSLIIGDINLIINELDAGGTYYDSRKSYEEKSSKFYELIYKEYKPKVVLDIGANYGFISIISSKKIPSAQIIAIEPSKKLIPYIEVNFKLNNVENAKILNAICGEVCKEEHNFYLNPVSSQDNRVIGGSSKWIDEKVPMINIDFVLKDISEAMAVFIKIDTQGYEEKVFKGGYKFLKQNNNWIIKTEFAPAWLKSQGTDPEQFLFYLLNSYDVAELPSTIPFFTNSINDFFINKIKINNANRFVKYVMDLNKNQGGWIDLLIRPLS